MAHLFGKKTVMPLLTQPIFIPLSNRRSPDTRRISKSGATYVRSPLGSKPRGRTCDPPATGLGQSPANYVAVKFGCEAKGRHKGSGGNFTFLDGHAKYVTGNPEEHYVLDQNGCAYEEYFSSDL